METDFLTVMGVWQVQHPLATKEELIERAKHTGGYMGKHWSEISFRNMNAYEINADIDAELELTRKANAQSDEKTESDNKTAFLMEYADTVDEYICELCKNDEILREFMAMFTMLLLQARGELVKERTPESRTQKAEQMAEIIYEVAIMTARLRR